MKDLKRSGYLPVIHGSLTLSIRCDCEPKEMGHEWRESAKVIAG